MYPSRFLDVGDAYGGRLRRPKAGVLDVEISAQDGHQKRANTITRRVRSMIRGMRRWRDVGKLSATLTDAKRHWLATKYGVCGVWQGLGLKVWSWAHSSERIRFT